MSWECWIGRPSLHQEGQEGIPGVMTYFRDGKDKMNRTAKRKKPSAVFLSGKEPKIPSSKVQSLHSSLKTERGEVKGFA